MAFETLDVVAVGNAIVDVLAKTDDAFIAGQDLHKGAMTLIETDRAEAIYAKMGQGVEMSGGSAANTVAAIALMGGACGFIGKVADDQLGEVFRHDIKATGVQFETAPLIGGAPSARCLILVTPDAQRTMCTFLGASVFIHPDDMNQKMIAGAKVTYLEGYLFDRPQAKLAFRRASDIAHEAGRKVALTLSDPFCVDRHRAEFADLVEGHVDILFANEAEIMSLYQVNTFDEAFARVRGKCDVAVITRSEKGALIGTRDHSIEIKAEKVSQVVDTTGAGDLFAAGFLYGYTQNRPLAECGRTGAIMAAEIITQLGARPLKDLKKLLKEKLAA